MADGSQVEKERRRRHLRRLVRVPATVRAGDREMEALVENLSPGGAFLRVDLPPGVREIIASIRVPDKKPVHVHATVRWQSRDGTVVGVQFDGFVRIVLGKPV